MRREINLTTGEETILPDATPTDATPPPTLDQIDALVLNEALIAEGSVFRGFVELVLDEINILRQRTTLAALPVRTPAQVKAGIKAKMRTIP